MEKEKILSTLKEKIGKTSLSERTISDYVEVNLPNEGTEPDDAYFERHTKVLKSLGGQLSHDVATAVEEAKKNFKPEPNKPREEEKPSEDYKTLLKEIQDMKAEMQKSVEAKQKEELLARLKKEMKAKGATDEYVLRNTIKGLEIDASKDFEKQMELALSAYDKELSDCRGDGATPRLAGGGKPEGKDDSYLQELKEKYIAEGKLPKE